MSWKFFDTNQPDKGGGWWRDTIRTIMNPTRKWFKTDSGNFFHKMGRQFGFGTSVPESWTNVLDYVGGGRKKISSFEDAQRAAVPQFASGYSRNLDKTMQKDVAPGVLGGLSGNAGYGALAGAFGGAMGQDIEEGEKFNWGKVGTSTLSGALAGYTGSKLPGGSGYSALSQALGSAPSTAAASTGEVTGSSALDASFDFGGLGSTGGAPASSFATYSTPVEASTTTAGSTPAINQTLGTGADPAGMNFTEAEVGSGSGGSSWWDMINKNQLNMSMDKSGTQLDPNNAFAGIGSSMTQSQLIEQARQKQEQQNREFRRLLMEELEKADMEEMLKLYSMED